MAVENRPSNSEQSHPLPSLGSLVLKSLALVVLLGALYFVPAWRVDLPVAWVLFATYGAFLLAFAIVNRQRDPGLLEERSRPGPGVKTWDQRWIRVYGCVFFAFFPIAGLDVGWIHKGVAVPLGLQVAGVALFLAGLGLSWWATSVNSFFSRMVRIQGDRGQRVVTDGPYRYIRHPGYAMALIAWPGAALGLGSWWALVPGITIALLFIYRAAREDQTLQRELPGYSEYAQKVRYRLVPGVW